MSDRSVKSIIFANAPISLADRYGDFAFSGAIEPPLGLCYLASETRKKGYKTSIIDAEALNLDKQMMAEMIIREQPDYLGISSTTLGIFKAAGLAELVKQALPGVITILGASHVTALPQDTMANFPCFDYGVIGEGEVTLIALLACLENHGDLAQVAGIVFRRGGEIVITAPRELLKDIDSLGLPAWDLLPDISKYRLPAQSSRNSPVMPLLTSRGCPCHCAFCDRSMFGARVRLHSAEYVLEMMRVLQDKYGVKEFHIEDDIFTIVGERLRQICQAMLDQNVRASWSCFSRVDSKIDLELMRLMKKSGCWQIKYGIESGSQRVLDIVKKGITIAQIESSVARAKQAGLMVKGFFILGLPGETEESIAETLRLMKRVPFDDISFSFFTPYPGTAIYMHKEDFGRYGTYSANSWDELNTYAPAFIPNGFTYEKLQSFHKKIVRSFFLRPRVMLGYLRRLTNLRQLVAIMRGFVVLIKYICKRPDGKPA